MAERGVASAAAAEVAAYRTRDAKDYGVDVDERREEWIARAAEFDLGAESIEELLAECRPHEPAALALAQEEAALASLESTSSHFDRRDVVCALAAETGEGASAAAIEERADRLLASDRVVLVHEGSYGFAPTYFTTPRVWEPGAALRPRSRSRAAGPGRPRSTGRPSTPCWSATATSAPTSGRWSSGCSAAASGSSRWRRCRAPARRPRSPPRARHGRRRGTRVIGVATARSAAGELNDAGVPSTSTAALLIRAEEARSMGVAAACGRAR